jgi:hypothetical protein
MTRGPRGPNIPGAVFRFSTAQTALEYAKARPSPSRVVLVPDERPYGHYWVVSLLDALVPERRGYKVVSDESVHDRERDDDE